MFGCVCSRCAGPGHGREMLLPVSVLSTLVTSMSVCYVARGVFCATRSLLIRNDIGTATVSRFALPRLTTSPFLVINSKQRIRQRGAISLLVQLWLHCMPHMQSPHLLVR